MIGDRGDPTIPHFSPVKKILQRIGSFVVRKLSKTSVMDAPSGFRAIHRRAAMQLNVFNEYSYTIETIIQAGYKNIVVASVPVRTNPDLRPSRLVKSIGSYIARMLMVMFRIFITYRPLRFFFVIGTLIMLPGVALGLRYLWLMANGLGPGTHNH